MDETDQLVVQSCRNHQMLQKDTEYYVKVCHCLLHVVFVTVLV